MLPNKSSTQKDLAAWGRLSGIKKAPPERGELTYTNLTPGYITPPAGRAGGKGRADPMTRQAGMGISLTFIGTS